MRYDIFHRKYSNENKIVDLSLLPPCQSVLKLHSNRASFVAKIWKSAGDPHLPLPDISLHRWTDKCKIQRMHKAFPNNIEELLLDDNDEETASQFVADDDTDNDNE